MPLLQELRFDLSSDGVVLAAVTDENSAHVTLPCFSSSRRRPTESQPAVLAAAPVPSLPTLRLRRGPTPTSSVQRCVHLSDSPWHAVRWLDLAQWHGQGRRL